MKLKDLLVGLGDRIQVNDPAQLECDITGVTTNSHACQPGDLFIGMPGTRVDGGDFWPSAIAAGAVAAIVSTEAAAKVHPQAPEGVRPIAATDMTRVCAAVASQFYGNPARSLFTVGITGTNGKTTTTHLVEFLLSRANRPTALLGTLYTRWPGFEQTAIHTTPFAPQLHQQLGEAVKAGAQYAVMEVSSHSLAQDRVLGIPFEVGIFTNLTQDHLDFHRDMEDYFEAKARLFAPEYLRGRAVINADDPYGRQLIERVGGERVWSYSLTDESADLYASELSYEATGVKGTIHTPMGEAEFSLPLVGQYNLANLLAAIAAGLHLGLDLGAMVAVLPEFGGVPGRMERVSVSPEQKIAAIVDYAHTPDSLENVLKATRPFVEGQLICVFGCGGDRDRTKRPMMGKIAAELADRVVVTSDNPRTEDPERILEDIVAGIPDSVEALVIGDRAQAIRTAIAQAQPGDGVVIAGKGHEDYQILGTEKIHFDDREQARLALAERFAALPTG
ncbi:UDP-N-acetylmuramoyl-L-alanyl-D-glutamate--2,6-diaminopimelate ligase [Oxynema sp. CENA135]|uniref:UDP-N-acetylmuramoyl-L-alanyl-D-glutamate--2, 6-diaminopimelate ligase n=1 Tax=Oxynema sp. CENA135 TaxID=984206 RepID=UPI00190B2CDF|nr:UDP-N-acetylmuramoyl-L-alanyl-D-glutamate--2,6-diaminopimelate ligase [Oxynema sp. CENA135]MBK4728309.1 UDP-N-acetylmuramoyl-L-alanyl-D-glutamate--2,6-diaminopimelate ligase [Oxynema sp. CENA135]